MHLYTNANRKGEKNDIDECSSATLSHICYVRMEKYMYIRKNCCSTLPHWVIFCLFTSRTEARLIHFFFTSIARWKSLCNQIDLRSAPGRSEIRVQLFYSFLSSSERKLSDLEAAVIEMRSNVRDRWVEEERIRGKISCFFQIRCIFLLQNFRLYNFCEEYK